MKFKENISVKVCGLTRKEDIQEIAGTGVSYAGFIFYPKSGRFVEGKLDPVEVKKLDQVKKVGVFVNALEEDMLRKAQEYGLDFLQLHGEESPETCQRLGEHYPVIKAFKIKNEQDIRDTNLYSDSCEYFLFDTAGKLYGGNGALFNWELLKHYQGTTPFFLSGGIGPGEVDALKQFQHPSWMAIDVNSRFEDAPGQKNLPALKQFLWDLNIS